MAQKLLRYVDRIERESLEGMRLYFQELAPLLASRFEDPESPRSPKPEASDVGRAVLDEGGVAKPPASVTETVKTVPDPTAPTAAETPPESTWIQKLFSSVASIVMPSAPAESGKRQIGQLQSVLLVLLAMGLAVASMNTYWVIGLGSRLDRTSSRMDRAGVPTAESFAQVAAQMKEKSDDHWRKVRIALVDARVKSFALQERLGGLINKFESAGYEGKGDMEVVEDDVERRSPEMTREIRKTKRRELLDSIAVLMEKYDEGLAG